MAQRNRMTVMWCSFAKRPINLRAYGSAKTVHEGDADWAALGAHFPPALGTRQFYDMTVDLVQSSCGYAVPFFDHVGPRDTLARWADDKGEDAIRTYWAERNQSTLDGTKTGTPNDT